MRDGRETARGVGTVSAAVSQALQAIYGDLNTTVDFTTGFAKASDEQAAKLRELVTRLRAVTGLADAAVEGAQQTSAATQQQMASLGELTTTSQRLSEAATQLSQTVRRFETS